MPNTLHSKDTISFHPSALVESIAWENKQDNFLGEQKLQPLKCLRFGKSPSLRDEKQILMTTAQNHSGKTSKKKNNNNKTLLLLRLLFMVPVGTRLENVLIGELEFIGASWPARTPAPRGVMDGADV